MSGRNKRGALLAIALGAILALMPGCLALSLPGSSAPEAPLGARPAPGLSGEVRDPGGQPISGAAVRAFRPALTLAGPAMPLEAPGRTDEGGRFHIPDAPRGLIAIAVASGPLRALLIDVPLDEDTVALDVGTIVARPPGRLAGRVLGPPGVALLGTEVEIPGTDLVARTDEAGAFAFAGIPAGRYRLRARQARLGSPLTDPVEVAPGPEAATAPDLVLSFVAPALVGAAALSGAPGARLRLTGRHFGTDPGEPFEVVFGSLRADAVERASDTVATVVVPQGARSGPLAIVRDGIPSNPLPFQVIASVSVAPTYAAVRPGEAVRLTASARDTEGLPVSAPALSWEAPVPLRDGAFRPEAAGFYRLIARTGQIAATATVAAGSATLATVMGDGIPGDAGDGGPASAARMDGPRGLAVGPDGTLYVADGPAGKIRTIGPDGTAGTAWDGLEHPVAVARSPDGALWAIEAPGIGPRRLVRRLGEIVQTVASGSLYGLALDPEGQVVAAARDRVLGAGGAVLATGLDEAIAVAFDGSRNLLVGGATGRIWRVAGGSTELLAGGGTDPGPDVPAPAARLGYVSALAPAGETLYFVDARDALVRALGPDGRVRTVAGDGYHPAGLGFGRFNGDGLALGSSLDGPTGLALLPDGALAISDTGNRRVRRWRP